MNPFDLTTNESTGAYINKALIQSKIPPLVNLSSNKWAMEQILEIQESLKSLVQAKWNLGSEN